MSMSITAKYDDYEGVRNAEDDLRSTGIESDRILIDKETNRIKVIIADVAHPEIEEILGRHNPVEIKEFHEDD